MTALIDADRATEPGIEATVDADGQGEPAIPLVTFWIDGAEYALPVAHVQEIVRVGAITRVPAAPAHVRGLTTHRGRLVAVLELPGNEARDPRRADARMVTVEIDGRLLGLLVDRTGAVIATAVAGEVARWQGRALRVLDLERLVAPC